MNNVFHVLYIHWCCCVCHSQNQWIQYLSGCFKLLNMLSTPSDPAIAKVANANLFLSSLLLKYLSERMQKFNSWCHNSCLIRSLKFCLTVLINGQGFSPSKYLTVVSTFLIRKLKLLKSCELSESWEIGTYRLPYTGTSWDAVVVLDVRTWSLPPRLCWYWRANPQRGEKAFGCSIHFMWGETQKPKRTLLALLKCTWHIFSQHPSAPLFGEARCPKTCPNMQMILWEMSSSSGSKSLKGEE